MSLKDLSDLTKTDAGYNYTLDGIYVFVSTPYQLLYTYYLSEFLFEAIQGNEEEVQAFITANYNVLNTYSNPTPTESDFVADYQHFISS